MNKIIKKIILVVISIIILFTLYLLFIPKTYIKFTVAPQEVYISINNENKKIIKNQDSILISPGNYTITVSQNEFKSYTEKINITENKTTIFLAALTPLTEKARKIMESEENIKVIERFESIVTKKNAKILLEKYPIINDLPITSFRYQIYGCKSNKYPNDSTKLAICIGYIDGKEDSIKQTALNRMKTMGYNPDNYEIIIKKSENALKGQSESMPK